MNRGPLPRFVQPPAYGGTQRAAAERAPAIV